jgi:hypothetical protein
MTAGYLHPDYSAAVAGELPTVALAESGGRLIVRNIPGTELRDAMAPYPFLVCRDWTKLPADMANLPADLVSVTAVTDPLSTADEKLLRKAFNHTVRPYKTHYIVDLTRPLDSFVIPHHRLRARRARRRLSIEQCQDPSRNIDEWLRLYTNLVARHDIAGAGLMDAASFRRQFRVPGLIQFRASLEGETVGLIHCAAHGDAAYYHLAAFSPLGYRRYASYALLETAIEHYAAAGLQRMSLGGGAGAFAREEDGLAWFKRGWSTSTATAYLCGHVNDAERYEPLCSAHGSTTADYFPAYRSGEYR